MDLLKNYAYNHGIGVIIDHELPAEFNSRFILGHNLIIINPNYLHQPEMTPFIFAHELGHAMADDNEQALYYLNYYTKIKVEGAANQFADHLLKDCCERLGYDFDCIPRPQKLH